MTTEDRGFASMDPDKQKEIASKGGHSQGKENNPGNFANRDPNEVRKAAHEGGSSQGKENNPGNFANDREKAREAGKKGGEHSHGGGRKRDDDMSM